MTSPIQVPRETAVIPREDLCRGLCLIFLYKILSEAELGPTTLAGIEFWTYYAGVFDSACQQWMDMKLCSRVTERMPGKGRSGGHF